ncbi:MAG: hypothetical protein GY850_36135 [bacterium]|nr:hypothetical protein [bacterium]
MRRKEINVIPGFDGEYGQVRIFKAEEREQLQSQAQIQEAFAGLLNYAGRFNGNTMEFNR